MERSPLICQLAEAISAKVGTLSQDAQKKLEINQEKQEKKAGAKAAAALQKQLVRIDLGVSTYAFPLMWRLR